MTRSIRKVADEAKASGGRLAVVYVETPANPTNLLIDIEEAAAAIRELGQEEPPVLAVDNTFLGPLWQSPLEHGADLALYSLTKYVGGHSDCFMGSAAVTDPKLGAALHQAIIDFGWAVSPDDAYTMLRGLRTLPTRMARHGSSSLKVAAWLESQAQVGEVLHPALPGAPGHKLFQASYSGAPGLFAFVLKGAAPRQVLAFLDALKLFGLGFSWGGFESLALDGDDQFKVRKAKKDYGGPVIRLAIGLEDPDDLIADLEQALAVAAIA